MDVKLILFKKDGAQKVLPLPDNVAVIGRRRDCDLRIPLMSVSRRHCQIINNKDTLKVRDLGSHNGTYLNDKRIDGEATIQAGDYLKIGPLTFLLQINGQPKEIVPPKETKAADSGPKVEQKKEAAAEAATKEDSFFDLNIDEPSNESDSFLDELEDL